MSDIISSNNQPELGCDNAQCVCRNVSVKSSKDEDLNELAYRLVHDDSTLRSFIDQTIGEETYTRDAYDYYECSTCCVASIVVRRVQQFTDWHEPENKSGLGVLSVDVTFEIEGFDGLNEGNYHFLDEWRLLVQTYTRPFFILSSVRLETDDET